MDDSSFTLVAGKRTIVKDPNDELDYTMRFTSWLAAASDPADTIASVTAQNVVGVTVDSIGFVGALVVIWVSGGTVGTLGSVTARVVTTGGRTVDRTAYFRIKQQ